MAEICKECFMKIFPKVKEKDIIISKEDDICEECGEIKKTVDRVK